MLNQSMPLNAQPYCSPRRLLQDGAQLHRFQQQGTQSSPSRHTESTTHIVDSNISWQGRPPPNASRIALLIRRFEPSRFRTPTDASLIPAPLNIPSRQAKLNSSSPWRRLQRHHESRSSVHCPSISVPTQRLAHNVPSNISLPHWNVTEARTQLHKDKHTKRPPTVQVPKLVLLAPAHDGPCEGVDDQPVRSNSVREMINMFDGGGEYYLTQILFGLTDDCSRALTDYKDKREVDLSR